MAIGYSALVRWAKVLLPAGAVVTVETHDAFEGKIASQTDRPSEKLNFPYLNPQTGPIFVKGAEKGDTLAVRINAIRPREPMGTTCLIPEFGGLVGTTSPVDFTSARNSAPGWRRAR